VKDNSRRLKIALVGTRGVPARYGGFETAVEEIGQRLAARGHLVTVYCRNRGSGAPSNYLGMTLVNLPALRSKSLETLSHTALSVIRLVVHRKPDVVILFNAANAPFLPFLRLRGIPVSTHVDGLEWKRSKWGGAARSYYRVGEALAVRWSNALIADAQGIADYYRDEFGTSTELIAYGAPILDDPADDRLAEIDLSTGNFHLIVARFEPENHVDVAVAGYLASSAKLPLVVVGAAPYADEYTERIGALASTDSRIRLLGAVWDQTQLDQLYANALTYIHGHSVGGTNPSLLRAIGAGTAVLAYDVVFNREVLGSDGQYFIDAASLASLIEAAEADVPEVEGRAARLQQRAREEYRWDDVADRYEKMCRDLAHGVRLRAKASGRRRS
jgi:glycosyltransferase involved in cell wall biosynthesis